MPAAAPPTDEQAAANLSLIGRSLLARRKQLGVSAAAAAEAAGLSRVTLHRIERGEPSVTLGAYANAAGALGLELALLDTPQVAARDSHAPIPAEPSPAQAPPRAIVIAAYPQLQRLAWHAPGAKTLTPRQALNLYERNWRHVDREAMTAPEKALVAQLVATVGKGVLLV